MRHLTAITMLLFASLLSACSSRPGPEVLTPVSIDDRQGARKIRIYAATTRARADGLDMGFTAQRSRVTNYVTYDMSIPPQRKAGEIEWPDGQPDPIRQFAVTSETALTEGDFLKSVGEASANNNVGLFVHGYNVSHQEALFRTAQMAADSDLGGVPMLFSWPSKAALSGYVTDKESVTFSRDNLVHLLIHLAQRKGAKQTFILAHSMGTWLTMEALRQLRLLGRDDVLAKLKVMLAAPDIDGDVFLTQLAAIGRMKQPITVFVAKDDLALRFSSFLAGDSTRVGAIDVNDPAVAKAAKDYGVQIVDISTISANDSFNHNRYAALASVLPRLEKDSEARRGAFSTVGAFVLNTAGATLSAPFTLAGKWVER